MGAASERAEFIATLNATSLDKGIEQSRARVQSLDGATASLDKNMGRLQQTTARGAGAVMQLGGVMGGASGEASKLLGLTGNLAGSFMQNGMLGVAVVGIGALIGVAADRFDLFGKKADAAAKKAAEHFDKLKDEINDLDLALQAMVTGKTIERIKQQAIVAKADLEARAAIDAVGGADRFARLARYEEEGLTIPRSIKAAYDVAIEKSKEFALQNQKLVDQVRNSQLEKHLKDEADAANAASAGAASKGSVGRSTKKKGAGELVGSGLMGESALQLSGLMGDAAFDDEAKAESKAASDHAKFMASLINDAEKERTAFERAQAKERVRIAKEEADAKTAAAQAQGEVVASLAVALATDVAGAIASGGASAEAVSAMVLGKAAEAAGGFITLEGAKLMAGGTAELIASLGTSPHGWAMVAGGGALIAAGQAVAVGGPAAVNQILGISSAGAGGGRGGGGRAQSDRGIDDRPRGGQSLGSSSGAGGDGLTVNNYYSVGGPIAEDAARATIDLQRMATRRRMHA